MKKMMIMVSAIMMVAASYAKENVETMPFEGVKVNVPARVRFVNGENYAMGIRTTDSITANNILWSIEDGVLNIRSRYEADENNAEVCITIVSPVEPKLTVGRDYEVSSNNSKKELAATK